MVANAFEGANSVPGEPPASPAVRLTLCLLGPPQVLVAGEVVMEHKAQKALALLAYLAVEAHRPHQRSVLAALFWPDHPETRALQNLRKTLSRLRTAIGDRAPSRNRARSLDRARSRDRGQFRDQDADPPHLLVEPETIQFNRQSNHWLDVAAFRALGASTAGHRHRRLDACPSCLSQLAQASAYYRGDFLKGLHPAGSPALDEWLLLQREQLQQQACVALQALANSLLARGKSEAARHYARRLLLLDPWNEAGQRLMLRALALSEGRNAALQHYRAFRRALADELGVEPEDATLTLVDQIGSATPAGMQLYTPAGSLPTPITPFVGQEAEQRQIADYLAGQDQRLITLHGPGGSGKTRLALEIATEQAPLWQDGVWFVPLAEVPSAEGLEDALASALGLRAKQLDGYLRPKELLLILDSFEHLVAGARLLGNLVRSAPEVKILVTSRTRLGLPGEWAIELQGLDVPAKAPASVAEAETYSAVQLFLQSARRVAPGFGLSPDNLPHVVRTCQLVAGLPLGIQLAAGWVRMFHCRQIADEIQRSPDFLHSPHGGNPGRQHSLRATFDYSYNLLPDLERSLFCRLSVFRGGFETEAAMQVTGAGPSRLACLLDKSLLQSSPSRRLNVHPTLREFAAEKLAEQPGEEQATRERHCSTYLSFVRQREETLRGANSQEALAEIESELGNVREAWRWAIAQAHLPEIEACIDALSRFFILRGLFREGEAIFGSAADRMLALVPETARAQRVACRSLAEQARFLLQSAQYARASQVAEDAAALAHHAQATLSEATACYVWGEALWRQGNHAAAQAQLMHALHLVRAELGATAKAARTAREVETASLSSLGAACWIHGDRAPARTYLQQALEIARADGDLQDQAKLLTNLGVCALEEGNYTQASTMFQQSVQLRQAIGDRRGESITLGNLGNVHLYVGAYAQAKAHYEQALHIQREIGARNDEALSVGNLGLVYHYLGDHATARQCSYQALQIAQETGERRTEGAMWMKLGHALTGLRQFGGAAKAYQESVALRREMGWSNVAMEPLAGLARVALAQGDLAQAQAHVEEILHHLEGGEPPAPAPRSASRHALDGTISPFEVYLTCYRVLEAGQDPRARDVLATAYALLQDRAARIAEEEMQRSFLESVSPHRQIVRAFLQPRERE